MLLWLRGASSRPVLPAWRRRPAWFGLASRLCTGANSRSRPVRGSRSRTWRRVGRTAVPGCTRSVRSWPVGGCSLRSPGTPPRAMICAGIPAARSMPCPALMTMSWPSGPARRGRAGPRRPGIGDRGGHPYRGGWHDRDGVEGSGLRVRHRAGRCRHVARHRAAGHPGGAENLESPLTGALSTGNTCGQRSWRVGSGCAR